MISLLKVLSMITLNNLFCKLYFLRILYKYFLKIWLLCSLLMILKIIIISWNFQLSFTKYVITFKNDNWFRLNHTSIMRKIFQFFERLWQINNSISFIQLLISSVKMIYFEIFKLSQQINNKFLNFFNSTILKFVLIVMKKLTRVL